MQARPVKRGAAINAPRANAPAKFDAGGRKTHPVLLPSLHVVVFVEPNVGELLEMEETAITETSKGADVQATNVMMSLRRAALRKLLKAMTVTPAAVVYRPGTDLEAIRAEATKAAEESGKDVETAIAIAETAAEDVQAMISGAQLQAITDWMWDDPSSYLNTIQKSALGTLEAADWSQLNAAASDLVQDLVKLSQAPVDPKVLARMQRPQS